MSALRISSLRTSICRSSSPLVLRPTRLSSTITNAQAEKDQAHVSSTQSATATQKDPNAPPKKRKTQAELDEELRLKMAGIAGDGGESGVEYEDGQPVSMKRSVKNNMFRYI